MATATATAPMKGVSRGAADVFESASAMYDAMHALTSSLAPDECVRCFCGCVPVSARESFVVETPLFPRLALLYYTASNLGGALPAPPELADRMEEAAAQFQSDARGGSQGLYRDGIEAKVANVIDCLRRFPGSKRAVLTIPYSSGLDSSAVAHDNTVEAKCLRELHLFIDAADGRLHGAGFMRAQATLIFPKNMHFIGTLMHGVADQLGVPVGTYTHFVTTLVHGR